jgi:hypothetical protein
VKVYLINKNVNKNTITEIIGSSFMLH